MHLETLNSKAADFVSGAIVDMNAFRRTKRRDQLESAAVKIDRARAEDPSFLPVLYCRAMLDDLRGRSKDAIEEFQKVLEEKPPFSDEVEYYLGLAHYHRYSWPSLEKAMGHFSAVATRTKDPVLECRA